TIAHRAAIARKIQHRRLFSARRYVPDDYPLAVLGIERDLLGFREAGRSGRCMQSLREIHQRALRHIHQRDKSAEGGSGSNEPFEQRHGSSIPWGPEPTQLRRPGVTHPTMLLQSLNIAAH